MQASRTPRVRCSAAEEAEAGSADDVAHRTTLADVSEHQATRRHMVKLLELYERDATEMLRSLRLTKQLPRGPDLRWEPGMLVRKTGGVLRHAMGMLHC